MFFIPYDFYKSYFFAKISISFRITKKSRNNLVVLFFLCNFALRIRKITSMDKNSEKYNLKEFEGEGFVSECLEEFDANVAKVEAEYAVTGKSA